MAKLLSIAISVLVSADATYTSCPAIHQPDIRVLDIRLKPQAIPKELTTYACQQFQVPHTERYEAVAFEPIIGNRDVVHHMLLFGCENDMGTSTIHQCGAQDGTCSTWFAQYSLGVRGPICLPRDVGVQFGKDSFTKMLLQVHWNNNNASANATDDSGFRIYYTTTPRAYDLGNVQIGQNEISIPPQSEVTVRGSCSTRCTRMFHHPIYLTRTYIHMHYLGTSGKLELYRNGSLETLIAKDEDYIYDKSPIHEHQNPIEILPGMCITKKRTGRITVEWQMFRGLTVL
ncbi:DBH-like monooxygenase protein 1 isoform X2 [Ostrea edulis]|uniref:DBH-like monooxygenase protein 1 isoform X2 n=1 Tax=Ostrea edulis TaxID=37623 RepID=UPI0024AFDCB2|nr:DBH-like monooxygenase protein 1 isoform X2 [Ostrea edulis]